ncbi:hypothetical protein DID80_02195 [Candidatus Marinamargulisbacteria bacterium SCGC AAA071-K20]|nr:hypothetical protein DID80_02195 [Candidatus Marinamargulisbacteria bacterium SCGC AAA071-K20]
MAFILKKPFKNSKGILVLKNPEHMFFREANPLFRNVLIELSEKYVIGLHWCSYQENVKDFPYIDFHLSDGTVTFHKDESPRIIPFDCKHFISPTFRKTNLKKDWDIFNMSRPGNGKYLDEFLKVIRLIFDERDNVKVLLICPDILHSWNSRGIYTNLIPDYNRMFSIEEKKRFKIIIPKLVDHSLFPFTQEMITYFINTSKICTLFSKEEGQSRILHESLLCGLPIVARKDLRGGGLNYLNEKNSRLFSTLQEAKSIFLDLIDNPENCQFDPEELRKVLGEEYNKNKFVEALRSLFKELNLEFEGSLDLEDLSNKLPSHIRTLPSEWTGGIQDQLSNSKFFYLFMHFLLNKDLSKTNYLLFQVFYYCSKISLFTKRVYRKIKKTYRTKSLS